MAKLFENTFRAVNIGLANELLLMCDKLVLNALEIIDAAATKPFGYMKFTPGPGLGGHCIPIDPLYLSWKLRTLNYTARFIDLASEVNTSMPEYWVARTQDALNEVKRSVRGSTIGVVGISYKKNISDMRESPALDIAALLKAKGGVVCYHDPHVPDAVIAGETLQSLELAEMVAQADAVIVVTDHDEIDLGVVRTAALPVIDTRNAL